MAVEFPISQRVGSLICLMVPALFTQWPVRFSLGEMQCGGEMPYSLLDENKSCWNLKLEIWEGSSVPY